MNGAAQRRGIPANATTLTHGLDIETATTTVAGLRAVGAAHLVGVLDARAVRELVALASVQRLERGVETIGPVRQLADIGVLPASAIEPGTVTGRLITELVDWLNTEPWRDSGAAAFQPDELTLMGYPDGDSGISPHRDNRRYRLVVASFSLVGHGWFEVTADRAGAEMLAGFACAPGDLVLIRGPGFDGATDHRPMHRVRTAPGGRLSLTLRMDRPG